MNSNVVIMDREADLSQWLKDHKVKILLRRTNCGWEAGFDPKPAVEGSRRPTGRTTGATPFEDQVKAIQALVWDLRGCLIGFTGPANIVVPEFTGIEEAVKNATRASEQ